MQYDDNVISKISPDSPSSVSTRQPLSSQYNLELLFLKENNHDMCGLHDSDIFFLLLICFPKVKFLKLILSISIKKLYSSDFFLRPMVYKQLIS